MIEIVEEIDTDIGVMKRFTIRVGEDHLKVTIGCGSVSQRRNEVRFTISPYWNNIGEVLFRLSIPLDGRHPIAAVQETFQNWEEYAEDFLLEYLL